MIITNASSATNITNSTTTRQSGNIPTSKTEKSCDSFELKEDKKEKQSKKKSSLQQFTNLVSNTIKKSKLTSFLEQLISSNKAKRIEKLPTIAEIEEAGISTKLPEYIYHLTNKKSYESMVRKGKIKQGFDYYCGSATFAFDIENLKENWDNILNTQNDMKRKLLKQAAKFGDDVVLLKIPTKYLDKDKLFVRSQNAFFTCMAKKDVYDKRRIQNEILTDENRKLINSGKTDFGKLFLEKTKELLLKNEHELTARHIMGETPATYASLINSKGEPFEYVYRADIPIHLVEKLGEIKLSDYPEQTKGTTQKAYETLFQDDSLF